MLDRIPWSWKIKEHWSNENQTRDHNAGGEIGRIHTGVHGIDNCETVFADVLMGEGYDISHTMPRKLLSIERSVERMRIGLFTTHLALLALVSWNS